MCLILDWLFIRLTLETICQLQSLSHSEMCLFISVNKSVLDIYIYIHIYTYIYVLFLFHKKKCQLTDSVLRLWLTRLAKCFDNVNAIVHIERHQLLSVLMNIWPDL
jgi:hypothetical protein